MSAVISNDPFTQLMSALSLDAPDISPSEVHGIIVGAIVNHLRTSESPNLLQLVTPDAQPNQRKALAEFLNALYRHTSDQLFDSDDGFELLMPDDDADLVLRTDALAAWCKGFLLGLLYNSRFSVDELPGEAPEITRDFMQIAEAEAGADELNQEEWALAELIEYVKVGAQLIFEFIYSEKTANTPDQTPLQ